MKFHVLMKTPDALDDAIHEAALAQAIEEGEAEDREMSSEDMEDTITATKRLCEKWFKHSEYVELEIDTDKGTCIVVE